MVNAHVDLSFLTELIAKVQIPTSASSSIVRCDALDKFATQVGEAASLLFRERALSEQMVDANESRSMRSLLTTFVGLTPTGKCLQMLVGQGVIQRWMEAACPKSDESDILVEDIGGNNVLLDVLLTMASEGNPCLSEANVLEAMLQSFREGGQIWECRTLKLPERYPQYQQVMKNLEEGAKNVLKHDLGIISRLRGGPDAGRFCRIWSKRCMRCFQLRPFPSLDFVGLNNTELWVASYTVPTPSLAAIGDEVELCAQINPLYSCLKLVLQNFEPSKRREMLCGAMGAVDTTNIELVLHVLLSLANTTPSQVPRTAVSRQQLCHDLFDILRDLPRPYTLGLCKQMIAFISREMKQVDDDGSSREVIDRSVVVFDVLAEKAFGYCSSPKGRCAKGTPEYDAVSQESVREGHTLYYIAKNEDGAVSTRGVQCQVVTVHTDDYPNLYFTIRLEREDGVITERQTVANRLRKLLSDAYPSGTDTRQSDERSGGSDLTTLLLDSVIKPHLSIGPDGTSSQPFFVAEAAAECASVAISRLGLGDKSGLGSTRYEMFQIVSTLERLARDSLTNGAGQVEVAATLLRCLALVLGYGILTAPSSINAESVKLSSLDLAGTIHDAIDSATKTRQSRVATLMWLNVALSSSTEGDAYRQAMFIFEVIASKLSRQSNSQDDLVVLLRAFFAVQKQARGCIDYSSTDTKSEKETLSALVRYFVATSVDEEGVSTPLWLDLFSSLLQYNLTRDGEDGRHLFYGAREWNEALCDTLFSPLKRRCGYQLLINIASEQRQINPGGQISTETRRHLKRWKADLDSEEAEELQDDTMITSKWLPECLMNVVEGWSEMSDKDRRAEDEEERIGKLLSWLVCLSFLDNAAAVDIRNRGAITLYLDKTSAVTEVLLSATLHANLTDKKTTSWMSCLDATNQDESLSLSDVATLAVFRTIESVPTLSKKWYSDYCPRASSSAVISFVEKRVAPEMLKRELRRIGNVGSTFGEMSVTGSCVSRVITATYVQDESTLSVQITVPPTFPLRNAEVDCKKTLGIPNQRWRRWELQITRMLNHEDGSILDALLLWKQNVDKEFEGVEPCPVCYSVLCVKTHTMPNLECKTCSNRFHSNCLMKWFKSSGKSQCVMCQQSWSGTKIT